MYRAERNRDQTWHATRIVRMRKRTAGDIAWSMPSEKTLCSDSGDLSFAAAE